MTDSVVALSIGSLGATDSSGHFTVSPSGRAHLLHAIEDDPLAGLQALADHQIRSETLPGLIRRASTLSSSFTSKT
jgi:hypothetical protein